MQSLIRSLDYQIDQLQTDFQLQQDSWTKIHQNMLRIIKFNKIQTYSMEKQKNNIFQQNSKTYRKKIYSETISANKQTNIANIYTPLPKLKIQSKVKLDTILEQNNKKNKSYYESSYSIYHKQSKHRHNFSKITQNKKNDNNILQYFSKYQSYNAIHLRQEGQLSLYEKLKRSQVTSLKKLKSIQNKNLQSTNNTPLKLNLKGSTYIYSTKQNNKPIKKDIFNNNALLIKKQRLKIK